MNFFILFSTNAGVNLASYLTFHHDSLRGLILKQYEIYLKKKNAFQLCVWGHAMAHSYSETPSRKEVQNVYFKSEEVLMEGKASAGGAVRFPAKTSIQPHSLCQGP